MLLEQKEERCCLVHGWHFQPGFSVHFHHYLFIIQLRSNNPHSLILLVHTANVPFRAQLGQPQASYRLAGKEAKHRRTKPHAFCKESQHVPCALREAGSPGGVQKAEPLPEE